MSFRRGAILLLAAVAAACAPPAPIAVPPELPFEVTVQRVRFRWVIERQPDLVRAVGVAEALVGELQSARLDLVGLDAEGRVTARGTEGMLGGFAGPQPFAVTLRPTGREARFELYPGQVVIKGLGVGR